MNSSPLKTLHEEFSAALKQHAYMGESKQHPIVLEKTDTKEIRLNEVFKLARLQIDADIKSAKNAPSEVSHLRELQEDGKIFYERYQATSNTWTRLLLKGLAYYTPTIMKEYLPACFSNRMADAEKETQKEYEEYKKLIQSHIRRLSQKARLAGSPDAARKMGAELHPKVSDDELSDDLLNQLYDEDAKEDAIKKGELKLDDAYKVMGEEDLGDDAKARFLKALRERQKSDAAKSDAAKKTDQPKGPAVPAKTPVKPAQNFFDLDVLDEDLLDDNQKGKPAAQPGAAPAQAVSEKISSKPVPLPAAPVLTKEEMEANKNKALALQMRTVEKILKAFKEFDRFPLSLQKCRTLFTTLHNAAQRVLELEPVNGSDDLEKAGLPKADREVMLDVVQAMAAGDKAKVKDLLQPTLWKDAFAKAEAQIGHITFGVKKFAGITQPMLQNDQGGKVKETDLATYHGKIRVVLSDVNLLTDVNELVVFLRAHDTCRPCTIEVSVKDKQTLTPDLVKVLLTLCEYSSEIQINGMTELNFKTSAVSADEEHQFVQHLENFNFQPPVPIVIGHLILQSPIILSDHSKKDWSAADFSAILKNSPTPERLKELLQLCSSPKDIILPIELLELEEFDFSGLPLDLIPHLAAQMPSLKTVSMNGSDVTDDQLALWIASGCFKKVQTFRFEDCKNLTTDVLHALMALPNLSSLTLPDLPAGKLPLDKLPEFDNPFKINLFYTASQATRKIAAQRYTGPTTWAPAFQIPMARAKEEAIFTTRMTVLDPKSVAFWLYNEDYKELTPQDAVRTILADSNAELTDANLIEFVKKFPKAAALSLYNCPNITSAGIINLLKECPQLMTLDLTGCPHITEALFFEADGNMPLLGKLSRLIITDTGITKDIARTMQEDVLFSRNLEFEETTLTINDSDLTTDDDSLEKLLKGNKLNTLKRINLEGCTKLTNAMLAKLLDHLNADIFIKDKDGAMIDNPQRLNIAVLNLSGCTEITEEAFHGKKGDDDKIEPKHLGNLARIIIGGAKIDKVLRLVYPGIIFQEHEEPVTIAIDPAIQLQMCQVFHTTDDEDTKFELAQTHVFNRIAVELFQSLCDDQDAVEFVRSHNISTNDEEFCDITLTFKTDDKADPSVHHAHRDVLYSRSLYFVNGFRPGGLLSKLPGLDYINVHATKKASKAVMELLYGQLKIDDLDWETAADVAELAGPHIFRLPASNIKALLDRIHSQFEANRAEKMLTAAQLLNDKEGISQYEETLIAILESLGHITATNNTQFRALANIAKNHNLTKLKQKTDLIEVRLTRQIEKSIMDDQAKENEAIIRKMVAADKLKDII